MWALFTRALTAHSSATQVSILNTSANFLVTAVLGVLVFAERLGALWVVGAACLVVGNVVIGRKASKEKGEGEGEGEGDGFGLVEDDQRWQQRQYQRQEEEEEEEDLVEGRSEEESGGGGGGREWDALLEVGEDDTTRTKEDVRFG